MRRKVVRPNVASLNSLAEVVRQAQPLYAECRSILNYLDAGESVVFLPPPEALASGVDGVPANEDGASLHPSILEPVTRSRNTLM